MAGVNTLNVGTLNIVYPPLATNTLIIPHGVQSAYGGQIDDMIAIQNPKDPTKLIALFDGLQTPGNNPGWIGEAWAWTNRPTTWYVSNHNPFMVPSGGWEGTLPNSIIRVNGFTYDTNNDQYVIWYCYGEIGRATVPLTGTDGYNSLNVVRDPNNPLITPSGDETQVQQFSIIEVSTNFWFGSYEFDTASSTEPNYRGAFSPNGTNSWTKIGNLFTGTNSSYYEWHQTYGGPGLWWMSAEEGITNGARWHTRILYTTNAIPTNGWTLANGSLDDQTNWFGYNAATNYNVATPSFFTLNGQVFQLYQVTVQSSNYNTNTWDEWQSLANNLITVVGTNQIYLPTVNTNW